MNKVFLCLFITAFAECFGQDYVNNNLDCVYGKRSYHGPDDAQASVRVTSHDNMIEVLVDLKDDRVFFSDELIKSDHIELWFAIDTLSRNYILDGEVYENIVGEAVSVESFLSYKAQIRSDTDPPPLDGNESKPELISDFTGMVHWGFDLKNKTATLFDTSLYYLLTPAGSLSKFITVKSTGASSYSILIKPAALGFSARNIISSLHMMADVFDADGANDLSVLSTSVHRMWGKRNSFTDLKLSSPLTIGENLNPDEVIAGGLYFFNDGRWEYYYGSSTSTDLRDPFCALNYLPLTYDEQVQTLNDSSKVYIRDYRLERFVVYPEMIRKVKFKRWSFACYDKACSGEVDGPAAPDITIEIVKKDTYAITTTSCSRRSISGYGACGSCDDHSITFFITKENALHELFTLDYSLGEGIVNVSSVASFQGSVIAARWSEKHDAIIIDCSDDSYRYSETEQSDSGEAGKTTCNRYTIIWDKHFTTKVKKTKLACP